MSVAPPMKHPQGSAPARPDRRTLVASTVGTVMEWYDFNLYGLASALVFGKLFFPTASPTVGTLASFATFAVGFAARPLGGLIFGSLGDRIGRSKILLVTMLVMGLSSTLIGALPTYATIGIWAPILLVTLRVLQGIGVGGEFAGATLLTIENSPANRRGFYGAVPAMGTGAGFVLASAVFAAVSMLPEEALLSWGWRIPFLASIILVAFGLVMRRRLGETAEFSALERKGGEQRSPLLTTLRKHPGAVIRTMGVTVSGFVFGYLIQAFTLSYGTSSLGIDRSTLLWAIALASALEIVTIPMWGALSDRFGRRTVVVSGLVATALYVFPFFALLGTGSTPLIFLAYIIAIPIVKDWVFGPQAALVAEMFTTDVRYSGVSTGREFGGAIFGGTAPFIGTALYSATGSIWPVCVYVMIGAAISVVATVVGRKVVPSNTPELVQPTVTSNV